MKKLAAIFGFAVLAVPAAHAGDEINYPITQAGIQMLNSAVHTMDMINWKVGDEADFNVTMASLPINGKMVESVESDTGTALWIKQDMNLMIQQQTIEELINKADGKILQMKQNGQPMQVPDQQVQVVSEDYTQIDVPAGHFQAIHVIANVTSSGQQSKVEMWANPRDTVMEGTLKQIMSTQMGDITTELASFKHGN